ncbi:hypothetical protein AB4072_14965 [Microvirga sp. 2MCAF38]|uniref:hypothetical protein n=1 Tax=Microvirga sp. 2MCAF38 TaxID=3232989 RepID=UPI003F972347
MTPFRTSLASALIAGLVLPSPADATPASQRLLKIEVRVEGQESWQDGPSNFDKAVFKQRYFIATVLEAAPDLSGVNIFDPNSVKKAQEKSARVQTRAAQQSNTRPAGMPSAAQQQAMQAAIQQAYARCKGDETCIRDAVMKSAPQLMTPPPGATMASRAPASDEEGDEKEIYQHWQSFEACPGRIHLLREDSANGLLADVGGPRATKSNIRADERKAVKGLCVGYGMTVVDTEAKKLFLDSFSFSNIIVANAPLLPERAGTIPTDIIAWVNKNLRNVPLSGTKTETIALRTPVMIAQRPSYSGRAKITLTWSFEGSWNGSTEVPEN